MGEEQREVHYGTVRTGLAEAGVQARVRHPFVHGRDGAGVDRLVNWLFSHQTGEKVLFGLIAVAVLIAIATNPYVGVAAVATAVVVFFWGRHRQGGVVVGGKHGDDNGSREPDAPPPVVAPDELPEFAKKADDLEAIKKAVDDAASVSGGLWLSYLFVLFYLAVAAGAVTHTDLFFEKAVKLPFLGIELPLVAFFFMAPILFVIVHTYTLVHLVMLTDKAKRYHQALDTQIKDANGAEAEQRKATRDKLRRQLPSNIFIQFLAGPSDLRESAFGRLLLEIARITLVIAPVLLLLTIQIQFLPYHSWFVAWTQRIALMVDIALVWWLWRKVLSGGESDATAPRASVIAVGTGLLFSFLAIAFSCAIATFPSEWQEDLLAKWGGTTWVVAAHDALFSAEPSEVTHRRFPFSNTLVLPGLNVYEGLGIDDPEKAKWRDFVFRPRGRDLGGAIFNVASLPRVDFTGANLRGARFQNAQLQGASLEGAYLQGASLAHAQLQGANLAGAQLQGAWLDGAQLQGADLSAATDLSSSVEVNLSGAQLQGASLKGAYLQGARLSNAQLQGAALDGAYLQGALLDSAQLQGVSFSALL
jgi:Pentapeptide repeats (8 copies)